MKRVGSRVPSRRGPAVSVVVASAASAVVMSVGVATASAAAPRLARFARLAPRSELSLARAPARLRAAVRRTLAAHTGSLSSASQQAKLTGSDSVAPDEFGFSVAISGSTAVVGAPRWNTNTGAAYVFVRSGTTWSQQAELTDPGGAEGDAFGSSVAISGSTAVVGSSGRNTDTGAAYVFVRSGTTWSQQAQLTASDGAAPDGLGASAAISGSTVVLGGNYTGGAYVFVRSGTTWSQQAKLITNKQGEGAALVAIYGSTAVVGAPLFHKAYVFVRSGTTWSQQAKLTVRGASLGGSVTIYRSTAVVGSPSNSRTSRGAAYVFVRSGITWSRQAKLTAGARGDSFGYALAMHRSTLVVSDPDLHAERGAAYVFVRSAGKWSQQAALTVSNAAPADSFGYSVAISGSTAVIGAPGKHSKTGAAYVFAGV